MIPTKDPFAAEVGQFDPHTDCRIESRIEIQGAVQGVGFRPFVYRLADDLGLCGSVINDSRGVTIEVEGPIDRVHRFLERLERESPPRAHILEMVHTTRAPSGRTDFQILESTTGGAKTAIMLPEIAVCSDCLAEVEDRANRRYGYPFTNCTNCGPRFTIIQDLPYDRASTTMNRFEMCAPCRKEYADPRDRRYHAQPNACPDCGPRLAVLNHDGSATAQDNQALELAAEALIAGRIVAVKGLGGFHLLVDSRAEESVERLRRRKMRYEKAMALMVRDVTQAAEICHIDSVELEWLRSAETPIVLLRRRSHTQIANAVAPDNPRLGVMLAYTPLHHLLLHRVGFPVVATSGNLSDEPICTDNFEAMDRLAGIADLFLVHDRPIERHCDDSVVQFVDANPQLLRRARGFAPMPIVLGSPMPEIVAVGAHLKNVIALTKTDKAYLSQHIGDMETVEAREAFESVVTDFLRMYEAEPVAIAHDLHPDYPTTHWAKSHYLDLIRTPGSGSESLIGVQHHHAHLVSCLVDNGVAESCLGVIWDGTGYGTDGTIWGGEFLLGDRHGFTRRACLRPFSLPGGDAAIRAPNRSALALLWEVWGPEVFEHQEIAAIASFTDSEKKLLSRMLSLQLNSSRTTSAGRLFDAMAALLDLRQNVAFEGQAAMMLEDVACAEETGSYPFDLSPTTETDDRDASPDLLEIDWEPMLLMALADIGAGVGVDIIAARFHNTLVDLIEAVAIEIGESRVALSGGCFQNRRLSGQAARRLRSRGLEVLMHRQVPCNDGGISLGQVAVAAARLQSDPKQERSDL